MGHPFQQFYNDTENTHKFIVLIISDFDIRVVPRFSNSFSSFGRNQIEVICIQPLTAFASKMISCAKIAFLLDIIQCLSLEIPYMCDFSFSFGEVL